MPKIECQLYNFPQKLGKSVIFQTIIVNFYGKFKGPPIYDLGKRRIFVRTFTHDVPKPQSGTCNILHIPNQDKEDTRVLDTFQLNVGSQNSTNRFLQVTEIIRTMIMPPNPNQEPLAFSTAPIMTKHT